jgi:pimeloyl-ACP methyl ester carboxylesterase
VPPETRYARSGDASIAYQVLGDGPFDLVFVPGFVSNLEYGWELPELARLYERFASFSRLLIFDKRGTGLSDRVGGIPPLEVRMDDVRAVMDAAGVERAVIIGISEGGPMTLLFAAAHPERAAAAVVYGSSPPAAVRQPDFPWAGTEEEWDEWIAREESEWGTREWAEMLLSSFAPGRADDPAFRRWWETWLRLSVSPGAKVALSRMNSQIDIRHVLPSIHVPTLVVHRADDRACDVRSSRYLAERIPAARYVELPGSDHLAWVDADPFVEAVREFLEEVFGETVPDELEPDRVLATVLFTDVVGSTSKAVELGDRAWRDLLQRHHNVVRRELDRFRGQEVTMVGDGFLATFDGPARGIRCARSIVDSVRELGLDVRSGLHTGECEVLDGNLGGIAVHIGARVAAEAEPGEVLVSSTVKDLVAGSGIEFADRGSRELKGVPGEWRLYAVER